MNMINSALEGNDKIKFNEEKDFDRWYTFRCGSCEETGLLAARDCVVSRAVWHCLFNRLLFLYGIFGRKGISELHGATRQPPRVVADRIPFMVLEFHEVTKKQAVRLSVPDMRWLRPLHGLVKVSFDAEALATFYAVELRLIEVLEMLLLRVML
ncbi:hypothetical protein PTKIN_Ptkin13bG0201500 [Pterospermum kingtungense]